MRIMRTWRLAALGLPALGLSAALAGPARAGDLAADLAGRSLSCGAEQALYIAPDLATITVLDPGGDGRLPEGRAVRIAPEGRSAHRLTLADAEGRRTYRLERPAESRDLRRVVLRVDDDPTGDDCSVTRGREGFVETRRNWIREDLCGNDPGDACLREFRRACGRDPTPACVAQVRPALEAINRRAGRG